MDGTNVTQITTIKSEPSDIKRYVDLIDLITSPPCHRLLLLTLLVYSQKLGAPKL